MRVHAFASESHFDEHLRAIWRNFPDSLRGEIVLNARGGWRQTVAPDDVVMVAAFKDAAAIEDRRLIYVEHGAGQTYDLPDGKHPDAYKYSGHKLPDNVIGCVAPRQEVADRWDVPAIAVGLPLADGLPFIGEERTIGITFHWPANQVCPEATPAFEHYREKLPQLIIKWRRQGITVLGHRHPRYPQLDHVWKRWKVPVVPVEEIRRRCSLLIADNTSLAYEMMHIARNVISLNAPWYRRDVEHGLRFWSHVPGRQVDSPEELDSLDLSNIEELHGGWNEDVAEFVYGRALSDGAAGVRAAAWITQLIHSA